MKYRKTALIEAEQYQPGMEDVKKNIDTLYQKIRWITSLQGYYIPK
jgi:hypothetical protein